ncbi:MAG TPA: NUDIX domain-containing protein [Candidatus Saccharimonadales bacterium]|jgi:ADP-ribose pyrophosphatase YjhB (NUDIX family)
MSVSVRAIVIKDNKLLVMDRNKFGDHYLSLVGGTVEDGEELVEALKREVSEETTLEITNPRLVIDEEAGAAGKQYYIYLCDYVSGEPKLNPDSIEAKIQAEGKNLFVPKWLDIAKLEASDLLPIELKDLLVGLIRDGFPDQPIKLRIDGSSKL